MSTREPAFETQTVERKKTLNERDAGLESLCGMVNAVTAKGSVEFGVAPDGTVVGLTGNLDTAQRSLQQAIAANFQPPGLPHEIHLQVHAGAQYVVVSALRPARVPFYEYSGRAFIREGSITRQLTLDEKRERLRADLSVAPTAMDPASIDITFDSSHHDVLGLGTARRRSAYRIGVRSHQQARLANVRAVVTDIRAVEEPGRAPLVWVARPVPATLRYWSDDATFTNSRGGVAVEAGATEFFGLCTGCSIDTSSTSTVSRTQAPTTPRSQCTDASASTCVSPRAMLLPRQRRSTFGSKGTPCTASAFSLTHRQFGVARATFAGHHYFAGRARGWM